ncbi:hypothetical protein QE152_g19291 [Popillia japonica]|uniref:Uncharacterized protein n=1 Tax=Popillia japonica TaxID=7064 RepID=A0AAW1KPM5_POPJA
MLGNPKRSCSKPSLIQIDGRRLQASPQGEKCEEGVMKVGGGHARTSSRKLRLLQTQPIRGKRRLVNGECFNDFMHAPCTRYADRIAWRQFGILETD